MIQGTSHFMLFASHFESISFSRSEPIMILGMLVMLVQGVVLSVGYFKHIKNEKLSGFKFGILTGLFFVPYIALVEPSKYEVPSVLNWFMVEAFVGMVQFGTFGVILGLIHKQSSKRKN